MGVHGEMAVVPRLFGRRVPHDAKRPVFFSLINDARIQATPLLFFSVFSLDILSIARLNFAVERQSFVIVKQRHPETP
eukprot:scaffold5096_cov169-Amphora_coffeaeformis.AAC.7